MSKELKITVSDEYGCINTENNDSDNVVLVSDQSLGADLFQMIREHPLYKLEVSTEQPERRIIARKILHDFSDRLLAWFGHGEELDGKIIVDMKTGKITFSSK